jgi:hypothetical protein
MITQKYIFYPLTQSWFTHFTHHLLRKCLTAKNTLQTILKHLTVLTKYSLTEHSKIKRRTVTYDVLLSFGAVLTRRSCQGFGNIRSPFSGLKMESTRRQNPEKHINLTAVKTSNLTLC